MMVNRIGKVLVIIACLTTGIISLLLAPIIPFQYEGTKKVNYSPTIKQINLFITSDVANIQLNYATDPNADLINISYSYVIGSSIIVTPPSILISSQNSTFGNTLSVNLTIDFPPSILSSVWSTMTKITLNPTLLSNLTIRTETGNILIDNSKSQNKTFIDLTLEATTGNIEVILVNESNIFGTFHMNSNSGNTQLLLMENVTLNNDFVIETTTGNIDLILNNLSLKSQVLKGIVLSSSGTIHAEMYQWLNPTGNLTLNITTNSGSVRLDIKLEADFFSSQISPQTSTGTIWFRTPHPGFNQIDSSLISINTGLSSYINVNITTISGNIDIYADCI